MFRKFHPRTLQIFMILSGIAAVFAIVLAGVTYFTNPQESIVTATGMDKPAIKDLPTQNSSLASKDFQYGSWPALAKANFFEQVKADFIDQGKSFIEADLTAMQISVYKDGQVIKQVPILTKGRPGSWWETPAGLYQIQTKEENHFSSFGHVYQPWSMAFQGNFFIHGWPYEPDGTAVSSTYSGGCIRLSTEDAQTVYDLAEVKMPVLVYEHGFASDDFKYVKSPADGVSTLSGLSAKEYLAADLKNNHVFLAKSPEAQVPIASITKLMTALIAAEYINLDANITVSSAAIVPTSRARLKAGQKVSAYQLLYPLLDESSNEAAFALADHVGRDRFVSLMNQKAAALGMTSTYFSDPAGREDGNVSTAEDLFALAKYLLNNRSFILKISAGNLGYNVYGDSQFKDLENFNVFNGQPDFVGGKIGLTTAAGHTIISIFNEVLEGQSRPVVIIALGSKDEAADARAILTHLKTTYQ